MTALVEQCKADVQGVPAGFEPVCEPQSSSHDATGKQGEIFHVYRRLQVVQKIAMLTAVGIALLATLPWVWYFALRRVRELATAIRAK